MLTVKERVIAFLVARQLRNCCDACMARALGIDPSTAYRAATRITYSSQFIRQYAVCSECGDSRLTTRAAG